MRFKETHLHILYWVLIIIIMVILFGRSWGNSVVAFYYISLLLPVIIATSYFFNYYLIPRFLLQKKYFRFALYSIYTLIVSLYLELTVLIFTFIYLLEYNLGEMNRNASDPLLLALVMYLIVFITSTVLMTKKVLYTRKEVTQLRENITKLKDPFLNIISRRKNMKIKLRDILYIESYSDHISIHLTSGEVIPSKERLSIIEKRLPDSFLRIHRSFVVNMGYITHFDYNEIRIREITLNIGRTYKSDVLGKLKKGPMAAD